MREMPFPFSIVLFSVVHAVSCNVRVSIAQNLRDHGLPLGDELTPLNEIFLTRHRDVRVQVKSRFQRDWKMRRFAHKCTCVFILQKGFQKIQNEENSEKVREFLLDNSWN